MNPCSDDVAGLAERLAKWLELLCVPRSDYGTICPLQVNRVSSRIRENYL